VLTKSACERTVKILSDRLAEEGIGFLTKALPSLGKWLDKSLALGHICSDPSEVGFKTDGSSRLPAFLGELFSDVFDNDGRVSPTSSVASVRCLRQILYAFYKLELPYAPETERAIVEKFEKTDRELEVHNTNFCKMQEWFDQSHTIRKIVSGLERDRFSVRSALKKYLSEIDAKEYVEWLANAFVKECERSQNTSMRHSYDYYDAKSALVESRGELFEIREHVEILSDDDKRLTGKLRWLRILRKARILLARVFRGFDPKNIVPSHGPGAVSTKEELWGKWRWTHVPHRITTVYPLDEYFFVNSDHVVDRLQYMFTIGDDESAARVCLVPKDSRGPRLISCEPLANQWVQQGLGRAIVERVESCPLTRHEVHFTDQIPNQKAALLGSMEGKYATLDLSEASDRVCLELVKLLFPEPLLEALLAVRTQETQLPDGRSLKYQKYAPMGSALCFPVLACTVWSLLHAGLTDAMGIDPINGSNAKKWNETCLVYGDDVVVPTAQAADAIAILESFGFVVNRDKSCTQGGLFRESCGMDAFKGEPVTPVRFRTVWTSHPHPEPFESYCKYASAFYDRGYLHAHQTLVELLFHTYGPLADEDWHLPVPSVKGLPEEYRSKKTRVHKDEQRLERRVLGTVPCKVRRSIDGWMMLFRFFAAKARDEMPLMAWELKLNPNRFANDSFAKDKPRRCGVLGINYDDLNLIENPYSAQSYTIRSATSLRWRWC
jgi:hypothetical protein